MVSTKSTPGSNRGLFQAEVIVNRMICPEHYLLTLLTPHFPATIPGHFIQLGCKDLTIEMQPDRMVEWEEGQIPRFQQAELLAPVAFLRRPFSLAGRRDTPRGVELDVVHRVIGVGTQWLADLKIGDQTELIGPLGNYFQLPAGKSIALLVGGGVGLPPMFYLAQAVKEAGWTGCAFVGATSERFLAMTPGSEKPDASGRPTMSAHEFAIHGMPSVINTDDGSYGMVGRVTMGLARYLDEMTIEQKKATVIYTCGPELMMRAVAQLAERHNIDCQACMEQAMACGMGTCQSCVLKVVEPRNPHGLTENGTPWRYKLACTEGPVFDARQVIW